MKLLKRNKSRKDSQMLVSDDKQCYNIIVKNHSQ